MNLRLCIPADAPTLALIGAATFLESYAGFLDGAAILAACLKNHTQDAYAALLAKPATQAWLAEVDPGAAPVGYVLLAAPDFTPPDIVQPGDIELKRIYLFSRFHGSGIAQRMMDQALASARQLGYSRILIGMHRENARALAFYRRNSFAQIGTRSFQLGATTYADDLVLALAL